MESKRIISKKIICIFIIFTMLINIFPNFGLLINTVQADADNAKIIAEIDAELGIVTGEEYEGVTYRGFAINIYIQNLSGTSFVLPIEYDNSKIKPGIPIYGRRTGFENDFDGYATSIDDLVADGQVDEEIVADDPSAESSMEDGKVTLEFLKSNGADIKVTDKTLICTIYFIVDDATIDNISKINKDIIHINESECEIWDSNTSSNIAKPEDFAMAYSSAEPTKELNSISVSGPDKKEYLKGDKLDLTNLVVTAQYSDGSSDKLDSSKYELDVADKTELTEAGVKEIKVTAKEKSDVSTTFKVLVFPNNIEAIYDETLNDIASKLPEKFSWVEEGTTKVGSAGTQQHKVKYTGTEDEFNKEKDITVKVAKKKVTPTVGELNGVAGQQLEQVTLPKDSYGTLTWQSPSTVLEEGSQTYVANYQLTDSNNYEAPSTIDVTVNVVAKKVTSIDVKEGSVKKDYIEGQTFNPEGIEVTIHYNDGTQETVKDNYADKGITFTPSEALTTDNHEVTVSCGEVESKDKISITVSKKVVTSIKVTTQPKNEYKVGDTLDLSKMVVEATYNDNSKKTLNKNEYTLSIEDGTELTSQKVSELNTLPATKSITITYSGAEKGAEAITTQINITVKDYVKGIKLAKNSEEASDSITINGTCGTELSQLLTDNNVNYVVIYGSGKEENVKKNVTTNMVSASTTYNKLSTVEQTLKIEYKDQDSNSATNNTIFTADLVINLKDTIKSITVTEVPNAVYVAGDTFNSDGIKIVEDYVVAQDKEVSLSDGYEIVGTPELTTAGLKKVTVQNKANTNIKADFYILVTPNDLKATYGQKLSEVTNMPANYNWETSTDSVGNATTGDETNKFNAKYTLQSDETILVGDQKYTAGQQVPCKLGIKVEKATLKISDLSSNILDERTYNGQIQSVTVTAPAGAGTVTVKYYQGSSTAEPKNAGEYTVKVIVTEGDNYKALDETALNGTLTIKKATLRKEDFDITIPQSKEYDGKPITEATADVKDSIEGAGTVTVKYYQSEGEVHNPTAVGEYTVKVDVTVGTNYEEVTGLEIGSFSITKTRLKDEQIQFTEPDNLEYDGTEKEAKVTVPDGAGNVTVKYKDSQGNISEDKPKDAGKYTVIVDIAEGENYAGEENKEVGTFEITKKDLKIDDLNTTKPSDKTYDGNPIAEATATLKPEITGADDVEITIKYVDEKNQETTTPPTNAGKYTVKVSTSDGKNYNALKETELGTFTINKANLSKENLQYTLPQDKTYDGVAVSPATVTVKDEINGAGDITIKYYKDEESEGKTEPPTDAGTYKVKVTVSDGTNYNALEETELGTFTISKATLTAKDFNANIPKDKEYDGNELTANPQIKESVKGAGDKVTVEYYKDGQKVDGNPTEVGKYTVKVSVNEGTNYEAAKDLELGSFSITKTQLKDKDITLNKPSDLEYDGTEKEATVDVPAGAGKVTVKYKDSEGNISEEAPKDAGTYTVVVDIAEGDDYAGVKDKEVGSFEITKKDLTINDLNTTKPSDKTYDGKPISPAATATVKDNIEGAGKVTVEYVDSEGNKTTVPPTNAGTYTVKVSVSEGKNYNALAETVIGTFTIEKADLEKKDLTYTMPEERTYDGTATKVEVTAPQGAGEVTVKYYKDGEEVENPTNAGTYTVKVTVTEGKNYNALNDEVIGTFTINKAKLTANDFNANIPANKEYDGNGLTANPQIKESVKGAGDKVTVEYYKDGQKVDGNPTAVGEYTVKVSVNEGTNYEAAKDLELGSFSITKTQLKDKDITLNKPSDLEYDGTEKEATVDVPEGAGDVTVKYVDEEGNESTTPPTDAGKYRVVVDIDEGDNYAGLKDKEVGSFEITKKDLTINDLNTTKPSDKTYDGEPINPAATATVKDNIEGAGKVTVEYVDSEGNKTTVPPTNAGTYTVKVSVSEGKNYNALAETVIGTFTIEKADLEKKDLTYTMPEERTYDGTATKVEVTAPQGAGEVTVKYYKNGEEVTNPTNAGTYTVKASVTDSENYNALEETELGTFTINKATPSITIDTITIIYEDTLAGKLPTRKDGTLTWQKDNNFDENKQYEVGTYNFKASFKPSDTENYNTVNDIDVKVIVNKKHINPPTVGTLTGIEGQALKDIASQLPEADTYGKVVWVDEEEILLPEKTTYQAKYELNDTNNYETTNPIEVTVNVKAKEVERIEITTEPSDTDYIEGQTFDPTGMVIKVYYNDGTFAEIKENYTDKGVTFTPNGALTKDDATVTVDFRGKTASQAITVEEDYVVDIIVTAPSKLEYNYGDAINLAGGKITRVWASGVKANDTIDMTKAMLSNSDIPNFDNLNSLGIKEITVKYENITKTNAFQITVNDYVSSIEIKNPEKLQTQYVYGDTINVKDKDTNQDLYIVVKYAGGTPSKEVVLTTEMLSGFSMTKLGQQTVTVTYEEKTDSYTINVKDEVIGIKITKEPARRVYKINDTVNFSDIVVRDVMKSGEEGSILTAQEYTISTVSTAVAGEQTVTVTKKNTNFTDTFKIKVIDATTEMNITDLPKDNYNFGEELDLSDGKITVKTQTGDKELPMTDSSVTVSGYNPHQLGEQTVTVTYTYTEETDNGIETKTMTDTFTVNVKDYWVEGTIKITAQPDKLTYKYGEPINLAGGKVARVMASGAIEDETNITGEMISGYDPKRLGIQTITVSYMGGTDTFTVTVVDETIGISINTLPNKTEYTQGEGLNLTGATINVTRLSGTEVVEITSGMISGYNPNKVGPQVITVTYEGKTTSFVVNVKAKPVKPNKPSTPSNPSKPDSSENETYTVTFVDYDGTELKTETVAKGKSATAPEAPERKGYKFLGWNEEFDVVERDLTVVAEYEEIERAKVNIPGNDNNDNNNDNVIEVEKGKDLDLSDVTLTIKDEEGNDIDEIPVTEDMISGFDPNKVGTQTVTVTYVDENGFEYTATFKVRVTRPVETLGVKDEIKEDDSSILKDIVLPVTAGVGGVALLMLLIAWVTRKNVEIYALTEKERKLIGTEKISKNNARIELDKYEKDLENANIEVVLSQKITEKLDEEMVDIVFKGKKATYKVKYEEGKKFSIKIKNM